MFQLYIDIPSRLLELRLLLCILLRIVAVSFFISFLCLNLKILHKNKQFFIIAAPKKKKQLQSPKINKQ